MKDYHLILSFITAFSVVLLATPALIKVAKLKHLVDEPKEARKRHATSIPTIGGVIIFSAFIFSSFLWLPVNDPAVINGLEQFMFLMASLILLFFVGVKDDIIGMSPMKKLISHVMVGFIFSCYGRHQKSQAFMDCWEWISYYQTTLVYYYRSSFISW